MQGENDSFYPSQNIPNSVSIIVSYNELKTLFLNF